MPTSQAIDEIGWTRYHWQLFFLAGFGYAVDSMLILVKSSTLTSISNEFNPSYSQGILVANNVGLILGALVWGLSADMLGRKWAFNLSLVLCSVFGLAAGAGYVCPSSPDCTTVISLTPQRVYIDQTTPRSPSLPAYSHFAPAETSSST